MNPDDFKDAWKTQSSQTRLTIDAELLLQEVRRNEQYFTATIFLRDLREVGTAIVMVPVWIYLGIKIALPWTWYLMLPALVWIAGFMLVDRKRHQRQPPDPGESLRQRVECSLAQVDHQIWLLRNVFWWYLLPPALAILAFFGQVAWRTRALGWSIVLLMAVLVIFEVIVFAGIYRLNQYAVRAGLVPRRQELEALLTSLKDEAA